MGWCTLRHPQPQTAPGPAERCSWLTCQPSATLRSVRRIAHIVRRAERPLRISTGHDRTQPGPASLMRRSAPGTFEPTTFTVQGAKRVVPAPQAGATSATSSRARRNASTPCRSAIPRVSRATDGAPSRETHLRAPTHRHRAALQCTPSRRRGNAGRGEGDRTHRNLAYRRSARRVDDAGQCKNPGGDHFGESSTHSAA